MATEEARYEIAIKAVLPSQRRLIGWAYVARKADGTLPFDSGGTTKDQAGNVIPDATQRDVIDTAEAMKALEDSFYEFLSSGKATADDMHREFGIAPIVGGIVVTPEVTKALGIPDGTLPTGVLCVIDIPKTPQGDRLLTEVVSGEKCSFSSVMLVERQEIPDAA